MIVDVKAVKGRVAFTAVRGGTRIPDDRYISTGLTTWIQRLEKVHGDIEVKKPEKKAKASQSTVSKADEKPASKLDTQFKLEKKDEK